MGPCLQRCSLLSGGVGLSGDRFCRSAFGDAVGIRRRRHLLGDTGLTVRLVRRDVDGCVLAVSGELSLRSAGVLSERLWKACTAGKNGRVLVDVSGLRLTGVPAVQVFSWTLAGLGDWPQTQLVLFGATPELTRELTAMRVTQRVPVAPDETAARLRLDRRPPVVVRTLDLAQELASARRAPPGWCRPPVPTGSCT